MNCPKCNTAVKDGMKFCPKCGTKIESSYYDSSSTPTYVTTSRASLLSSNGEMKALVCPHCGANTTNTQNCEYCGSLLVRFVDKGLDLSQNKYAKYINNNYVIKGLIDELKQNLKYQEQMPSGTDVSTDIYMKDACISVFAPASKKWYWIDGNLINGISSSTKGLIITFRFFDAIAKFFNTRPLTFRSQWKKQDEYIRNFRSLDSYPLFSKHASSDSDEDLSWTYTEYAIDFGCDAEGAARLVSDIILNVYDGNDEYLTFKTNVGQERIDSYRAEMASKSESVEELYERASNPPLWQIVAIFIVGLFFIWLLFTCNR